ncbi:protein translocase subunit SecF [Desulfovibrio sp. OttesenSCG-928-C14]|nr:protein translocase subunit SecF [Desulfovibrio sp. OttesenSCG-928-C14]
MGLHIIPSDTKINFVGFRKTAYIISAVLLLAGLLSLVLRGGLSFGIDFAGGSVVQVQFDQAISDEDVKNALSGSDLPGLVVQSFGDDSTGYLLRISGQDADAAVNVRSIVTQALDSNLPGQGYKIVRLEMVGPKVGADLRSKAMEALFLATLLIAVYVSGRFEHRWTTAVIMAVVLGGGMYLLDLVGLGKAWQVLAAGLLTLVFCWKLKLAYALGAIVSIAHDLFLTVGIFSILGKEFDLTIIAALLTVVGYSLNDTIIVFDRIRENLQKDRKSPLGNLINLSVNQTLSRTLLTSGTTLLVIVALLVLGGDIIFDFALALLIGVVVGTYSSIFVASPILLFFEETIKARLKEDEENRKQIEKSKRMAQV